ncbi:YchJ family protein [Streptomyces sp. NPDC050560]|uniref:YchJ family protein n=1 Tax=Streptomyces sp. NPDC050560 TaxID=3365630 RepID=UPI0037BA7EAE
MAKRSRRTARRPSPAAPAACPCGRPAAYADCCGRLHAGGAAATAEDLMRSRYSAFAVGDEGYLLRTWHPAGRPPRALSPGTRWLGLDILATEGGSAFHTTGTVTFAAAYEDGGGRGVLRERSRFERVDGAWVYVDGDAPAS